MKKLISIISFLCRLPGTFIVTAIILAIAGYCNKAHLDSRWVIFSILTMFVTFPSNLYLYFVQGEKNGQFVKGAKWIGVLLVALLTVMMGSALYFKIAEGSRGFPGDDAIQYFFMWSMAGVLAWAWFSLVWNSFVSTHYKIQRLLTPPRVDEKHRITV